MYKDLNLIIQKNQLNFNYFFALEDPLISLKSLAPRSKGSSRSWQRSSWDCHSLALAWVEAEANSSRSTAADHLRYFDG